MPERYISVSLAGSWMSVFLYSMEITLGAYLFFYHKQNGFQKFIVGSSLLLDTLCTAVVCYNTWLHIDPLTVQTWCLGVIIMLTYLVSVFEQVFLLHRYWIIARNKIVLLLVLLGVIIHVVFGFISGIYVLVIRQPVYHFGVSSATIAAVTCAATDLFIAINMFHTARRINTIDTSVQNLLYRLSIIGMTNGIVTATTTTLMIILLFTSIEAFTLVFDLVGRVYTLTIVVNCVALKRQKPPRDESVTQTTRNSRRSGSVVLTTLELNTFTIPEDIETESSEPPSHAKSVPVARMRDTETPDSVIGVY